MTEFFYENKIVFLLRILLVEPEEYKLLHIYLIQIFNPKTKMSHLILNTVKYIASSRENTLYITIENVHKCKLIDLEK